MTQFSNLLFSLFTAELRDGMGCGARWAALAKMGSQSATIDPTFASTQTRLSAQPSRATDMPDSSVHVNRCGVA